MDLNEVVGFEISDLDMDVLPGAANEPVIHAPVAVPIAVFVFLYSTPVG